MVFCRDCRKIRTKDILELISKDDFEIFQEAGVEDAENKLKEFTSNIRLDLHKTLSTIDKSVKLPQGTCCVSYVGQVTSTRVLARLDIQDRIKSGQLAFGGLVFKRASHKDPDRNHFQKTGSKAWFNQLVKYKSKSCIFVDDSEDHVLSVQSTGLPGLKSIQIKPYDDLLELIK